MIQFAPARCGHLRSSQQERSLQLSADHFHFRLCSASNNRVKVFTCNKEGLPNKYQDWLPCEGCRNWRLGPRMATKVEFVHPMNAYQSPTMSSHSAFTLRKNLLRLVPYLNLPPSGRPTRPQKLGCHVIPSKHTFAEKTPDGEPEAKNLALTSPEDSAKNTDGMVRPFLLRSCSRFDSRSLVATQRYLDIEPGWQCKD